MLGDKSLFLSKTFWGAIVAAASAFAGIFGVSVSPDEQQALIGGLTALGTLFGTIMAIYGRKTATKRIR